MKLKTKTKNKVIFDKKFWEQFDNHIEVIFDRKLDQRLGIEEGQTLDDKLKYLPTKEEFYKKEDEVPAAYAAGLL